MIKITKTNDLTQHKKKIKVPEIRVWCHPHYVDKKGDDYYQVFNTFKEALEFIATHDEAETIPLIAYNGCEINIFGEEDED